jgi:ParB-like nuclease family protein
VDDNRQEALGDPASRVRLLSITELIGNLSPRGTTVRHEHVAVLVGVLELLPPIMVHAATMTVIDGVHRVEAFRSAGRTEVPAVLVDCTEAEARVMAVEANVRHGLPLTLSERRTAAVQILQDFPERSDRWVASMTGLSHTTIAHQRATSRDTSDPERRVGRDGRSRRTRPVDVRDKGSAAGSAGASASGQQSRANSYADPEVPCRTRGNPTADPPSTGGPAPTVSLSSVMDRAEIAAWLDAAGPEVEIEPFIRAVPIGQLYEVADLCRVNARWWADLARALEERARRTSRR